MGGSGGGGAFVHRSPEQLRDLVRKQEDKTRDVAFEAKLAETLNDLLGNYNSRDTEMVGDRLNELKAALKDSIEGAFDQLFGGSVAKHTYVDGLSDIDALILINDSKLDGSPPEQVLDAIAQAITENLKTSAKVSHGQIAVTVEYEDGMQIQLLPALKTGNNKVKVASSSREGEWSSINPISFQEVLSKRNADCGGKLVPTIKLAKAIIGQLPESQRLSGYHIEALGIAAFRAYDGAKTTSAMLPAFFEKARTLVLRPITDRTGQSIHVDGYLGNTDSEQRVAASHLLGRLARRMRNASAAKSTELWQTMFGIEK